MTQQFHQKLPSVRPGDLAAEAPAPVSLPWMRRPKSSSGSHANTELSPLEIEIMNIVWDMQECSSAEVIAVYRRSRHLADTTIRTVLANIRKKGYLTLVPSVERGYRLRPAVTREQVAGHSLDLLVSRLFQNSPGDAILYLMKDKRLTIDTLMSIKHHTERALGRE